MVGIVIYFFFFFQAEDGIRDGTVTGVQTCALPICSIYLCIELQSFSVYIISSLHRNSESSTGSALTYFLLGGLSSCFILLGIALIYANSGLTSLDGMYSIISDSERYVYFSK